MEKKKKKKQGKSNTAKLQLLSEYFLHSLCSLFFLFSTPPNPILTENASDEALGLYYSLSLSRKR